jgi:fermentation-respiration switch protein FrsA (DUF1100 family)
MKQLVVFISFLLTTFSASAQDITGQWNGLLDVQGAKLRLVFNITLGENGYQSTMDSPDQGVKGIPASSTTFEENTITISVEDIGLTYTGELASETSIIGTFKQGNVELPMDLSKESIEITETCRPQEPIEPYPYYSEEVTFSNKKAKVELAGTLTLPDSTGKHPVVILISGSGPQNRDSELMGHKPFLVISDFLTRNGIGVLRYDDRGTAQSTGDFSTATSYDFSTDVRAAIKYLKKRKDIDKKQIGLIGHSEGGLIAPMVASRCKKVDFIVLLAGTGLSGDQISLLQRRLIGQASRVDEDELEQTITIYRGAYDIIRNSKNDEELKSDLSKFLTQSLNKMPEDEKPADLSDQEFVEMLVETFTSPWIQYFLTYDPSTSLEKVKCPVLALNGSNDLQVPPKENLEAIKKALEKGGNTDFIVKELPNLNHLFQECDSGAPFEYSIIEQTFSPIALNEILQWIKNQVD